MDSTIRSAFHRGLYRCNAMISGGATFEVSLAGRIGIEIVILGYFSGNNSVAYTGPDKKQKVEKLEAGTKTSLSSNETGAGDHTCHDRCRDSIRLGAISGHLKQECRITVVDPVALQQVPTNKNEI